MAGNDAVKSPKVQQIINSLFRHPFMQRASGQILIIRRIQSEACAVGLDDLTIDELEMILNKIDNATFTRPVKECLHDILHGRAASGR